MVEPNIMSAARDQAIEKLGGQASLARLCGVSATAVWKWVKNNSALPAEHVLKVEAATGISRHELRPDIYPLHESPAAQVGDAPGEIPDTPGAPHSRSPGMRPSETPGVSPPVAPGVPDTKDAA